MGCILCSVSLIYGLLSLAAALLLLLFLLFWLRYIEDEGAMLVFGFMCLLREGVTP